MRFKKALLYVAIVFGVLAGITPFVAKAVRSAQLNPFEDGQVLGAVTAYIKEHGLQPEVNQLLADAPKPKGWVASYITESQWLPSATGAPVVNPDPQILAANPPELIGQPYGRLGPGTRAAVSTRVKAPDGTFYDVWIAFSYDIWRALEIGEALTVVFVAMAWLALALWVFLDAGERGSKAASGWLLLGLLTGPVALAVWLISRYTQDGSFAPAACPGCGATTAKGLAYCVQCGHALHPVCPSCGRTVEVEWSHCGHCGADLKEDA